MDIPKFETICDLFEEKPNAWEKVRPYLHLALMLAPAAVFGSFGTLVGTLGALDSGLTLAGAVELLENTLFRSRKQATYGSPYDLPRLANTMVIFAAWFDTIAEHAPVLWENLELDEAGWQWMQNECQDEYRHVQELVGGDGRNILTSNYTAANALERLYRLLADKTRKIAMGLSATEHLPINWDALPSPAVNKYFRYSEILERYENYYKWVHKQESTQYQPSREPGKLHLPASSSLLERGLFRGRETDLEQIDCAFVKKHIVVLTGLGGMGKTELAIAYANQRSDTSGVYFLSFQDGLRETIARAAMEGLPEYANRKLTTEEAYPIAWNLLLKCGKEDLLILDNVDVSAQTLNGVIKELGKLPMRCLVTTRYHAAGAIEVGKLPVEELLEIFDDFDAPVSPENRLQLIEAVDRHTLTVSLIAQTLQGGMVQAKTILDALEDQNIDDIPLPEVDAHFPGAEEQRKIYGHLRAVFLVAKMPDGARLAMTCAVLLPQDGMDADVFRSALDREAADALFSLSRNGWLSWQGSLISIHPVIRLVCKTELKPTDEICTPFLDQLWDQYDPNRYDQTLYRQLAELFAAASDFLEDVRGEWSLRAGRLWSELGQYHKALTSSQKALDIRQKVLPVDHPGLAASYDDVGNAYSHLGKHSTALEFQLKALDIRQKIPSVDRLDLATLYNNAGITYGDLYDHSTALEFQLKALDIQQKVLPDDHPDLATSYNNIGLTYGYLGDHSNAQRFLLKALDIWQKVLPDVHPKLALPYDNLGSIFTDLGEHSEALKFLLKALDIRQKVLPLDHPDLATSYNHVGTTYGYLGEDRKSLEFHLKALDIWQKILPPDHPDMAVSYNNLGSIYSNLGNHSMALEFLLKALPILQKNLPENHPHIIESYSNTALILARMDRFHEAMPYIQQAVTIAESTLPEDHPDLEKYRLVKHMIELCAMCRDAGIDFPNPFT